MSKSNSQELICEIIEILCKSFPRALKTKELAAMLKTLEVNVSRDIAILEKFDFVSKNENGIRLSKKFARMSEEMKKGYDTAIAKLEQDKKEFFSGE